MSGGSASHPDLAAAEALGPTRGWAMVDPTRDGLERSKIALPWSRVTPEPGEG
jgi:hypothetical protein